MKQIIPSPGYLVLTAIEEPEMISGFIVSQERKEKPSKGVVHSVSNTDARFSIGDTVLFKKYIPEEIELDSVKYLILKDDDIMAKII